MPELAIVAAMEREIRPLIRNWRVTEHEHAGKKFRFFETDCCVAVCGGIGQEAARRATAAIIALTRPTRILSVGFAGALQENLKVGQVFEIRQLIDARDGSRNEIGLGDGVLISFASVAGEEQKKKLGTAYQAQVVDMEAAGVARAADAAGIQFGAVKVVSDELGFPMLPMDRFIDPNGGFHSGRFAVYAAVRPWLWGRVFQLARDSSRAAQFLSRYLQKQINVASLQKAKAAQ
jgi:adenosylhomocysteine nucleosidase